VDYKQIVKNSFFRNFNFPDTEEPIEVVALHLDVDDFEEEYLSLSEKFAAFHFDKEDTFTYSFGL